MDENKEFQIFEDYTKSVCRKIMSLRKRAEVREELYSHLMEQYERNIALGMDDETAQTRAIEKMGDKEKIATEFGALYSVSPPEYMRSSLNFVIWGMLLSVFQINLFMGCGEITQFIGELFLLYGLLKLRKTDKRLNRAFYLNVVIETAGLIMQFIPTQTIYYNVIKDTWLIIICIFNTLLYWWIFSGINNLCKKTIKKEDKKPHLYLGFALWMSFIFSIYFSFYTETAELTLLSSIFMFVSLYLLSRAKKILSHEEPEFDLKQILSKAEKAFYWILVVILAIMPIVAMIAEANPDIEAKNHHTADTSVSQSIIDTAKNNMLELGFPEEYLKDLPDSEILNYSDATYLQIEEKEFAYNRYHNYATNTTDKKASYGVDVFRFYFADGEIRIMMRIEIIDENIAKYRNGLYLQFYEDRFSPAYDYNETGDYGQFYLALSEKDGETLSTEILSEYTPKNSLEKLYIAGFEFVFAKGGTNRRAYLAHSAKLMYPTRDAYLCTDAAFFWQEIPISNEEISINDMAISEFDDVFTFGSNDIDIVNRHDLYTAFNYKTSFLIKDELIDLDEV